MCGIVGAVASRPVTGILIDGLKRLEYRGYDSAGMAIIDGAQSLKRMRVVGKVRDLEAMFATQPVEAMMGIAHTRWATHGAAVEANAHPFVSNDEFALVHNGIIENHDVLRAELKGYGYDFHSETDSEIVAHLIHHFYQQQKDLIAAVRAATQRLEGAYALGVFSTHCPGRVIGVRQGAPLVLGKGQGENFLASDPLALLPVTQEFIYLEDDDIADIGLDQIQIYNREGELVERAIHQLSIAQESVERGPYRHYMKKEIMEQPDALASCLEGRIVNGHVHPAIFGPEAEKIFPQVEQVKLVACGTSYYAAMVAAYWLESLVGIPCSVEVASEFRYRDVAISNKCLYVTLSQSGETADSLAALRLAKRMDFLSQLVFCNVSGSTMMREAELQFMIRAGVEIGVASTKAFLTQLSSLFLFVLALRQAKGMDAVETTRLVKELEHMPALVEQVLQNDDALANWASEFTAKQHAIFLGRGVLFPIAYEGALKMKEISYIHAEGYPSGELKHGPLALVDHEMPVIATAPGNYLLEKTLSNLQEVHARGGQLFILSDKADLFQQAHFAMAKIMKVPTVDPMLTPILYTVPLQLLAYHVAVLKGTDVDQPRNLAKSVTVE